MTLPANPWDFVNPPKPPTYSDEDFAKYKAILETFFGNQGPFNEQILNRVLSEAPEGMAGENPDGSAPMDVIQRRGEVLIMVEVPGLQAPSDVRITAEGSTLKVEGETRRYYQNDGDNSLEIRRKCGKFVNRVTLPFFFDPGKINARYVNGLLEVRVPIQREATGQVNVRFLAPGQP